MDRLQAMRVFITVAEAGSLTAAARRLRRPLTSVSRSLAGLEAHLGAALVSRTTRRLALTDAGHSYLSTCSRVLAELDAAEDQISGRPDELTGQISTTAPVVFGRLHVLPILTRFLDRNPKLDARLMLSDSNVDLVSAGMDVAVRIGALPSSSLIATRVGSLAYITCASPAYVERHDAPRSPDDLTDHDSIVFSTLPDGGRWRFKSAAHGSHAVRVRPRLSVDTADAAVDAAVAGLGITRLLSYQAGPSIARNRLKPLLVGYDDTSIPVHLVHRSARFAKPQARAFIDFASRELRSRLARL